MSLWPLLWKIRMSQASISEVFHEGTKYSLKTLQSLPRPDWNAKPAPFKDFHEPRKQKLRGWLQKHPFPGRKLTQPLQPDVLSRLLLYAYGVTRVVKSAHDDFFMRSAPSAGGLYPTELYICIREVEGLQPGLYNYQCRDHSLVLVWEGDFSADLDRYTLQKGLHSHAPFSIILTGIFFRSAWRYHDRAYRRICLDTGHVLGNLLLSAAAEGLRASPLGGFLDPGINDLLFLDPQKEGVLAVMGVGFPDKFPNLDFASAYPSRRTPGEDAATDNGLLAALHSCSSIRGEELAELKAVELPSPSPVVGEKLEGPRLSLHGKSLCQTMLKRRSTRAFTGGEVSRQQLASLMQFAYHPRCSTPQLIAPQLLRSYLAVTRVQGLEPGIYSYDAGAGTSGMGMIERKRRGNPAAALYEISLGQELGRDAACTVFHIADLPRAVELLGDRAYRYLHLDAGNIGQRLNLAAVHLGLGVSGIGGFLDDKVNQLLDLPPDDVVIYLTVLGAPAPRKALG